MIYSFKFRLEIYEQDSEDSLDPNSFGGIKKTFSDGVKSFEVSDYDGVLVAFEKLKTEFNELSCDAVVTGIELTELSYLYCFDKKYIYIGNGKELRKKWNSKKTRFVYVSGDKKSTDFRLNITLRQLGLTSSQAHSMPPHQIRDKILMYVMDKRQWDIVEHYGKLEQPLVDFDKD